MTAGRLRPAQEAGGLDPFVVEPDLPDDAGAMLERTTDGLCVFLERTGRLCIVHRDLGESALPATCRHFPRVALRDRRGTSLTLSHFCPTAAGMLFRRDVPLAIVSSPSSFPGADYEGLVVEEDELPPLLRPGMLMDPEGYAVWEEHMVRRCAGPDALPESVLATLVRDAACLRTWRPGAISLSDAVRALPPDVIDAGPAENLAESLRFYREAVAAAPDDLRPQPDEDRLDTIYRERVRPVWRALREPVNRYIAAKSFASWTSYQGRGVATIVRGLEAAVALVRVEAARHCRDASRPLDEEGLLEAFRAADFILNHLAVGEDLAKAWSRVEQGNQAVSNTATTGP